MRRPRAGTPFELLLSIGVHQGSVRSNRSATTRSVAGGRITLSILPLPRAITRDRRKGLDALLQEGKHRAHTLTPLGHVIARVMRTVLCISKQALEGRQQRLRGAQVGAATRFVPIATPSSGRALVVAAIRRAISENSVGLLIRIAPRPAGPLLSRLTLKGMLVTRARGFVIQQASFGIVQKVGGGGTTEHRSCHPRPAHFHTRVSRGGSGRSRQTHRSLRRLTSHSCRDLNSHSYIRACGSGCH